MVRVGGWVLTRIDLKRCVCVGVCVVLPCSVCEVDSASEPQFDWTRGPRMVTRELPRFISAAFSGATWLNWTEDRQPTKPLDAACATFSLKFSFPAVRDAVKHRFLGAGVPMRRR